MNRMIKSIKEQIEDRNLDKKLYIAISIIGVMFLAFMLNREGFNVIIKGHLSDNKNVNSPIELVVESEEDYCPIDDLKYAIRVLNADIKSCMKDYGMIPKKNAEFYIDVLNTISKENEL